LCLSRTANDITNREREKKMGIDKIDKGWDREVDVVVLGAGPAGMAAAIVSKTRDWSRLYWKRPIRWVAQARGRSG
jgi:hypothetical protein